MSNPDELYNKIDEQNAQLLSERKDMKEKRKTNRSVPTSILKKI